MAIIDITTGQAFASIAAAITGSNAGDTIQIGAGTYTGDLPKVTHSLTIEGVGGMAHLQAPAAGLANDQGILVIDAPVVTLSNLELSGASGPSNNDAGVRFESGSTLNVENCWIHGNQDGILTNSLAGAVLNIANSEFNSNGAGDGFSHNIYVGDIGTLTVSDSYFHDSIVGHEIKSRAENTIITNNRIEDGLTATTSYEIDLPNGGDAVITGNVIQKSPNSENHAMVHFGGELNPVYANSALSIGNNIVVDDAPSPTFVFNQSQNALGAAIPVSVIGNTFYGVTAAQLGGSVLAAGNIFLPLPGPPIDSGHPFTVACFARGTGIATPSGTCPVEDLRCGDRVVSAFGGSVTVVWAGHRAVECRRHPRPREVWPVLVRAHAFADGQPARDLLLSPDHAVFVDDVLIPVRFLVNGTSIVQVRRERVTYYHVELPQHDVVLAQGLPCESYLDTGNRGAFANGGPALDLHPDFGRRRWEAEACAVQITHGPRLRAVAVRLHERARVVFFRKDLLIHS